MDGARAIEMRWNLILLLLLAPAAGCVVAVPAGSVGGVGCGDMCDGAPGCMLGPARPLGPGCWGGCAREELPPPPPEPGPPGRFFPVPTRPVFAPQPVIGEGVTLGMPAG